MTQSSVSASTAQPQGAWPRRVEVTPLPMVYDRLREALVLSLEREGYEVADTDKADVNKAAYALFRIEARSIEQRPRAVRRSHELLHRKLSAQVEHAVDEIERESRAAEDLNRRVSKFFVKAKFNDHLFNDLKVHHFHLGPVVKGSPKAGRTGDLLFAVVLADEILFLDVLDHIAIRNADFLSIMQNNWPQLLALSVINGVHGSPDPESTVTPQDRAACRAGGVTVLTTVGGKVMLPPGGGIATDGTSTRVVDRAIGMLRTVRDYYNVIVANAEGLADEISKHVGFTPLYLDLHAQRDDGEIRFYEANAKFWIYPGKGMIRLPQ
jgi:hypothetical protein